MSLSFYYEFTAPAFTSAQKLEEFLRAIEGEARALGFEPTAVLNVPFDTPERREFARRLGGSVTNGSKALLCPQGARFGIMIQLLASVV